MATPHPAEQLGNHKQTDLWQKAAIPGGLWAASEIILGSLLHNMRIPFSGTILAAISVALMVGYYQIWPCRGLIWRAGLIAAIMKSVSPSHLIMGPMIGIFTEAILLDMAIRIIGNNWAGAVTGGILALLSTILHKAVNLLLMYGWNIFIVYVHLYQWAGTGLGIENANPVWIISLLAGLYVALGVVAAVSGFRAGRAAKLVNSQFVPETPVSTAYHFSRISEQPEFRFSFVRLLLHIVSIPSLMALLSGNYHQGGILASGLYIGYVVFRYHPFLKRLRKPLFWIQLLIVFSMAAAFGTGWIKGQSNLNENLIAGLAMVVRALVVILGFTSLAAELRNPLVKVILEKKGFKGFYSALETAFSVLPEVIAAMPPPKQFLKRPYTSFKNLLVFVRFNYSSENDCRKKSC